MSPSPHIPYDPMMNKLPPPIDRAAFRFLIVLAATVVAFLSPSLLTSRILWPGDLLGLFIPWAPGITPSDPNNRLLIDAVEQLYPYYQFHRSEVLAGRLPLWNPYSLGGTPFLANSVSALFSPLRWLLMILPIHLYFEYAALIKLLLAGSGVYLFCRRLGLTSEYSALGSFCYLFAGYNVFFLTFPNGFISALLGWGLWQVESFFQTGRRRHLAFLAVILASAYLGGNMQCAALHHLAYVLFAGVRFWDRSRWRSGGVKTVRIALATGLGFALASIATIPFTEALLDSSTFDQRGDATRNPFHLKGQEWPALVQPHYREVPEDRKVERWSYSSFAYIGIVPFFLAVLGLASRPWNRRLTALSILGLWALFLLLGIPIFFDLWTLIPILRQANYFHAAQIAQISVAVLAGFGASALATHRVTLRNTAWVGAASLGLVIYSSWGPIQRYLTTGGGFYFLGRAHGFPYSFMWVLLTLLLLLILTRRRHPARTLSALIVVNGFVFGATFNTSAERNFIQVRPVVIEQLARYPHSRLVGIGAGTLLPNFGMSRGIRDIRGYEPLQTERWDRFYQVLSPGTNDTHHPVPSLDAHLLALLKRAGCEFVLSAERYDLPGLDLTSDRFPYLFRLSDASRLWIPRAAVQAVNPDQALARLSEGEPAVILEGRNRPLSTAPGTASWVVDLPDRVEIEVTMEGDGWLVLRDTFASGWRAQVDHQAVEIVRADYLFRAVRMPAGRHIVSFQYRPASFYWGVVVSLLSLIVVGWLISGAFRSRAGATRL